MTLPYQHPPEALQKARLDNIALVPASLLSQKATYQHEANKLPTGSVLCVPGTPRQQQIIERIRQFIKPHGRRVYTLPYERITRKHPLPQPPAEKLRLAL